MENITKEEMLTHYQKVYDNLINLIDIAEGYVVESLYHVQVNEKNGINGTLFAPDTPEMALVATVYSNTEDARKFIDEYTLYDKNNQPLRLFISDVKDYYTWKASEARDIINILNS